MAGVVLHLTGMKSTKFGGMEKYLLELAKRGEQIGFKTVLQYESEPESLEYRRALEGINAKFFIQRTSGFSPSTIASIAGRILSLKPDVIITHFSSHEIILLAALLKRVSRTKKLISVVHNVHNLAPTSYARHFYNRCDAVSAVSEAVRQDLLKGAVRSEVVSRHYLGVPALRVEECYSRDAVRRELGIPADALVLANIAFDSPFKGIEVLLDSMSALLREHPNSYLLQVGVRPMKSKLPVLARKLGIEERVCWMGIRDHGPKYLLAADLYIQSSLFGEGLPLALMEAMSLSLPTVVTDVAGNNEAVLHNLTGIVVPPSDPVALGCAIGHLADRPSERLRMGRAGYERYRSTFDLERSVETFYSKYLMGLSKNVASLHFSTGP